MTFFNFGDRRMSNEDLKQFLGTEIVYCETCGKVIDFPKGLIVVPRFCNRCFHENKELWQ
jgi:hypothetical protein